MASGPRGPQSILSTLPLTDVMTAWACIRLDRLRLGYRFVRLHDKEGMPGKGIILIKTEVAEAR